MSDFKDFFNFGSEANNFQSATLLHHGHINPRQLSESRAVQILQSAEVQQNIFALTFDQRLNEIAQCADFKKSQMPGNVDQRHLVSLADLHRKAHEEQPFELHRNLEPARVAEVAAELNLTRNY